MALVEAAMRESQFVVTEVVSGGAAGADALGQQWAAARGIPVKLFAPEWELYRRKAGAMRNWAMAKYAEALVAIWDGHSPGTKHMIDFARREKLRVYIHRTRPPAPTTGELALGL